MYAIKKHLMDALEFTYFLNMRPALHILYCQLW